MPESRKAFQAVEWLIDIRGRGVGGSGFLVFDSGQLSGGNEQGPDFYRFQNNDEFRWEPAPQTARLHARRSRTSRVR